MGPQPTPGAWAGDPCPALIKLLHKGKYDNTTYVVDTLCCQSSECMEIKTSLDGAVNKTSEYW